jgi:ribosomal protection tetracycline resistance protein
VPVLSGSAITGSGVRDLLLSLAELLPVSEPCASGPPAGSVFKIERDAKGSKSVYAYLHSGTLRVRDRLDLGRGPAERVTGIRTFSRGRLTGVREARGGQVVEIRGVESARIGDTFGDRRPNGLVAQFARPSLATVVEPRHERDSGRLHVALTQLAEQDPLIALRQDDVRRELQLSLYGEVQKEVIEALLAEEYGVAVTFRESTVICVERLLGTGHAVELIGTDTNPFLATVGLRVEPADVGAGVTFDLEVELGSMPPAFFTAVETAVHSTLQQGRCGWEVPDCRVVMTHSGYYARQSHAHGTFDKSMSSTAGDFRNLTRLVLATALNQAGTVVCEPIHRFELEVAEDTLAAVLALLATVEAIPATTLSLPPVAILSGHAPARNLHALTVQLPGVSRGEAVLTTAPDHFHAVTGQPPRRERHDFNPYCREEYLRRVTRSTTT